jgi:hypothetical protein
MEKRKISIEEAISVLKNIKKAKMTERCVEWTTFVAVQEFISETGQKLFQAPWLSLSTDTWWEIAKCLLDEKHDRCALLPLVCKRWHSLYSELDFRRFHDAVIRKKRTLCILSLAAIKWTQTQKNGGFYVHMVGFKELSTGKYFGTGKYYVQYKYDDEESDRESDEESSEESDEESYEGIDKHCDKESDEESDKESDKESEENEKQEKTMMCQMRVLLLGVIGENNGFRSGLQDSRAIIADISRIEKSLKRTICDDSGVVLIIDPMRKCSYDVRPCFLRSKIRTDQWRSEQSEMLKKIPLLGELIDGRHLTGSRWLSTLKLFQKASDNKFMNSLYEYIKDLKEICKLW